MYWEHLITEKITGKKKAKSQSNLAKQSKEN